MAAFKIHPWRHSSQIRLTQANAPESLPPSTHSSKQVRPHPLMPPTFFSFISSIQAASHPLNFSCTHSPTHPPTHPPHSTHSLRHGPALLRGHVLLPGERMAAPTMPTCDNLRAHPPPPPLHPLLPLRRREGPPDPLPSHQGRGPTGRPTSPLPTINFHLLGQTQQHHPSHQRG